MRSSTMSASAVARCSTCSVSPRMWSRILAHQFRFPPLEPGTYRLRIEAKDTILAEGTFIVEE